MCALLVVSLVALCSRTLGLMSGWLDGRPAHVRSLLFLDLRHAHACWPDGRLARVRIAFLIVLIILIILNILIILIVLIVLIILINGL